MTTFPSFKLTSETLYGKDTQTSTKDAVNSFLAASHANPSLRPENVKEPQTTGICGLPLSKWCVELSQNFAFLKMFQGYSVPAISDKSSQTWPKQGMVYGGEYFPLLNLAHPTKGTGYGLWLTPTVYDANDVKRTIAGWEKRAAYRQSIGRDHIAPAGLAEQVWLEENNIPLMISKWPTPTVDDANNVTRDSGKYQSLSRAVRKAEGGGKLSPRWVEWLIGWPIGWTSLEPLSLDYMRDWLFRNGRESDSQEWPKESAEKIQSGEMRSMWWDNDPSKTPYRPEYSEQYTREHSNSLPNMPHETSFGAGNMEQGQDSVEELRDMRDRVSTSQETTPGERTLQRPEMSERDGETVSRIVVGETQDKTNRLKAIGNGQVSVVAAAAWRLLTEE